MGRSGGASLMGMNPAGMANMQSPISNPAMQQMGMQPNAQGMSEMQRRYQEAMKKANFGPGADGQIAKMARDRIFPALIGYMDKQRGMQPNPMQPNPMQQPIQTDLTRPYRG